eukprot:TRINITY_DN3756_c0_g1_i1.p1 TRINITY_DN3756_c0_g1~~TRINITY_DN3756_c0_g1_i1.p1  ORF type:complete len:324 (-),score=37.06 TRINITY_DN3756_c0_g1_i1:42-1013(-)
MSSRAPLSLDLRSLREEPRMIATGALTCQQYDTSCRAWVPCAAVAGEGARESSRSRAERGSTQPLKVVTFNVWFSEMKRDARTKHILELCREHEPDFICLQEVVPSTLRVIAHNEWVQENYFLTDSDASTIMHYGVVILSRARPLSAHLLVLPSRMDRYLVSVTAMVGGVEVLCATVHLESLSSRDHRERQMRAIRQWIGDHPNVVWMGDFNFDDRRNWADDDDRPLEELTLREVFGGFTDVWLHTHGSEDGWTFDTVRVVLVFCCSFFSLRVFGVSLWFCVVIFFFIVCVCLVYRYGLVLFARVSVFVAYPCVRGSVVSVVC